jgi:lysophospholipid acyltransferase (LPLAT)-like uncharacterized protein
LTVGRLSGLPLPFALESTSLCAVQWTNKVVGWLIAGVMLMYRTTIRVRYENDRRQEFRSNGRGAALAFLHAHQIACLFGFGYSKAMGLVSRSRDGDLMIPSMTVFGVTAARGSSGKHGRDKGGATAFIQMSKYVKSGEIAYVAVDGPLGPRGKVHGGVARLATKHKTVILPVVIIPTRCWVVEKNWDRLQIPKPFSKVTVFFGDPIEVEGRTSDELCAATETELRELEERHDPAEAEACRTSLRNRAH